MKISFAHCTNHMITALILLYSNLKKQNKKKKNLNYQKLTKSNHILHIWGTFVQLLFAKAHQDVPLYEYFVNLDRYKPSYLDIVCN